jgi:hypothetical protein
MDINMPDDGDKPATDTFLSSIPPTDPAIIERMKETIIENRHYAAMGRIASYWSQFEAEVDLASIRLAKVHIRNGLCFTSQIAGIGRKLDAYISLARLREPNFPNGLVKKLCQFAESATGLSEQRNRVIHDIWQFNHPSVPERQEMTARKKFKIASIPTDTTELLELASKIDDFRTKFDELSDLVTLAHAPSPGTSPDSSDH